MLNELFRRAARLARAPLCGAAACVCASVVFAPAAYAGESRTSDPLVVTPFKHYQGWRDEPLQDWRQANQRVDAVGGWRTYLRESQPADAGAGQDSHNHDGHHGHHGH